MSTDFQCYPKNTPITDVAPDIMADMVNADCMHIRMLDALPLSFVLVMFDAYSWSIYERRIVSLLPGDNFDALCVFVSKATLKTGNFRVFSLRGSADSLVRRGGKL